MILSSALTGKKVIESFLNFNETACALTAMGNSQEVHTSCPWQAFGGS
jgi:hypothetical protein